MEPRRPDPGLGGHAALRGRPRAGARAGGDARRAADRRDLLERPPPRVRDGRAPRTAARAPDPHDAGVTRAELRQQRGPRRGGGGRGAPNEERDHVA